MYCGSWGRKELDHLRQRQSQKLVLCLKPRRVEFKQSTCPVEQEGTWPDLVAELLQGEGLGLSEVGNPCSRGGRGECEEDCVSPTTISLSEKEITYSSS